MLSLPQGIKTSLVILLLGCVHLYAWGQIDAGKRRSLYLEIAGSGGLGSINYEHQFARKGIAAFAWRAGLSLAPIDRNNGTGLVFPVMLHAWLGPKAHKAEFGLGQGITITTKGHFFALTTAAIGYRFQPEARRWFVRVAYTPLISYLLDFQYQHWAGVSVGFTFKRDRS